MLDPGDRAHSVHSNPHTPSRSLLPSNVCSFLVLVFYWSNRLPPDGVTNSFKESKLQLRSPHANESGPTNGFASASFRHGAGPLPLCRAGHPRPSRCAGAYSHRRLLRRPPPVAARRTCPKHKHKHKRLHHNLRTHSYAPRAGGARRDDGHFRDAEPPDRTGAVHAGLSAAKRRPRARRRHFQLAGDEEGT